jgi:hypothetical protein
MDGIIADLALHCGWDIDRSRQSRVKLTRPGSSAQPPCRAGMETPEVCTARLLINVRADVEMLSTMSLDG